MSLTLTTVSGNGGPLSAAQNDANMNAIMTEVNSTEATVSTIATTVSTQVSQTSLNGQFSGLSGGQQQVSWSNVINKPTSLNVYPFRMTVTGTDQQMLVTSGVDFYTIVTLNQIDFDPSSLCNASASTMTAPVDGYYQINASVEMYFVSGSPTNIGMDLNILKNGAVISLATIDLNNNTGTRVWRINDLVTLNGGDVISLRVHVLEVGAATWAISANENTNLCGFLVLQTA